MSADQDLPIVEHADRESWRGWLDAHHASLQGVWLKFAKQRSPSMTVTYGEALEEAICFGWIDGQVRRYDEHFYLQRFTPRRRRSKWSQANREKAERLIEAGRMTTAGQAHVDAAKADGRWEAAYPAQSNATVPEDLQRELDRNPSAKAFFETLTGSTRYAFLYRLRHVTKPDRRAKRIAGYIELLNKGRTLQD